MIVCIDSQICVWGIKGKSSPDQEHMIPKAERFFHYLDENKIEVLIPTIVLAEILMPEPKEIHPEYMEVISKHFIIAPFDERSAMKYAEILNVRLEEAKDYAKDNAIRREKMKMDHAIVATAIIHGCSCIYSHDKGLASFAKDLIEVREIPPIPTQTNLFS